MKRHLLTLAACSVLAGVLFGSGCKLLRPPKYVEYKTEFGDLEFKVPWGWSVYLDNQSPNYYGYTFVGPFEPDFYRGVPSLRVSWYAHRRYHTLNDGAKEMYYSAAEYIDRTLREVYSINRALLEVYYKDPDLDPRKLEHVLVTANESDDKDIQRLEVGGEIADHFIVLSPVDVPADTKFGVSKREYGKRSVVLRKHDYVVLPMDTGFYVFVYPATEGGYQKYLKAFNVLINTMKVHTDGPMGPRL